MNLNSIEQINKDDFKREIIQNLKILSGRTIDNASPAQIYEAVSYAAKELVIEKWISTQTRYDAEDPKRLYYMSMEFLTGRFLGNNLVNLRILDPVKEVLDELDISYNRVENSEPDPGLGNGGLGRLAACFLDSCSTLNYPVCGCGIRYRNGIFRQEIRDGYQEELPDDWIKSGVPWEIKRQDCAYEIKFGGNVRYVHEGGDKYSFVQENYSSVMAVAYDIPITGYATDTVNTLRLWDAEAIHKFDMKSFNEGNYNKAVEQDYLAKTIVEVLYPADEHISGKELRVKQQYFFVSATVQDAVRKFKEAGHGDFAEFPDKVVFQLNDTHPAMTVAELMRILTDQEHLEWNQAWEITTASCAYTNHTIMSEALEKWPIEMFKRLLPRIYMIIEEINRRFVETLYNTWHFSYERVMRMAVLDGGMIHMAKLAIVGSRSVNGVAHLHTEILKNRELHDFYEIYPDKFNNKTNGITQRRWLLESNPELAGLITSTIGDGWITNLDEMQKLRPFADDPTFRSSVACIKKRNKAALAKYIEEELNIEVSTDSIFDVQVKRLHEYKRQLLNVLHIIALYHKIKDGTLKNMYPRTFIFAAKAAAGYRRAKLIIKLINSVADTVNADPEVREKLRVVFLPNYTVSMAERIFPASDVSEQISTAGKEASGTGNMKFMLNGAVTLGTLDGANVEIREEVGDDNIFIFGLTLEEANAIYADRNNYRPKDIYYADPIIRRVLDSLTDGTFSGGDRDLFRELYDALLYGAGGMPDEYLILRDFHAYSEAQRKVEEAYRNEAAWYRMAVLNIAGSGKFSSDRTVTEYNRDIWHLK